MTKKPDPFIRACDRMWNAAHELDALRGDAEASDWLATHIRKLIRSGDAGNVALILGLATALEEHLPGRSSQFSPAVRRSEAL